MAYLINKYPSISHTFILREVLGMRALGLRIETASINVTDRPAAGLTEEERQEAAQTLYLKASRSMPGHALALARIALTRPAAVWRGLRSWARYGGWDLRARGMAVFYLAEAFLLGEWMEQRDLDHMHAHFGGPTALVALFIADAYKKTFSFTIHGPDEYMDLVDYRLRHKAQAAKFVVTISEFGRANLLGLLGMEARNHIHAIHLGVSPRNFAPVAHKQAASAPVHLVCVGRLVREKAQDVLLEALARLVRRGVDARLTLVGDGARAEKFRRLATHLGLDQPVTFTGALSQPKTMEVLRSADIFVLPSFAEGIPVALMEAMAMEIPCVSTSVTGIPELITSGVDGVLVPPGDVDALASALEELIGDPAARERLGQAGRRKVAREFNLDLNVAKLHGVFQHHLAQAARQDAIATLVTAEEKVAAA